MTGHDEADRAPLRRDAERNRARIVAAARELFAEHGLGIGFNEVAHRAGVGVGTVYRRFADLDELIEAALDQPLRDVLAVAEEAAAAPRAWDGLVLLVGRVTELLVDNMGVRDAALGGSDALRPDIAASIGQLTRDLFARAQTEGDLREGASGNDIAVLLWMVTELAKHAADVRPDAYRRYVTAFLDGLRAGPDRPALPGPLEDDDVAAISHRWADSSSRSRPRGS